MKLYFLKFPQLIVSNMMFVSVVLINLYKVVFAFYMEVQICSF